VSGWRCSCLGCTEAGTTTYYHLKQHANLWGYPPNGNSLSLPDRLLIGLDIPKPEARRPTRWIRVSEMLSAEALKTEQEWLRVLGIRVLADAGEDER
jgi:hypothetical protein